MARVFVDFTTPAAGFDQPLELWSACHGRVQRMIALLQRLAEHLRKSGNDDDARTSATSIRRYFDEAAPRHHDDEEIDLFVRLRERLYQLDAEQARKLAAAIATLESDHRDLSALWQSLRAPLTRIEAGGTELLDEATIAVFVSRYRAHMELEDTVIEPALKRLLKKSDLAAIGQAMAKRRGVDWSELAAR